MTGRSTCTACKATCHSPNTLGSAAAVIGLAGFLVLSAGCGSAEKKDAPTQTAQRPSAKPSAVASKPPPTNPVKAAPKATATNPDVPATAIPPGEEMNYQRLLKSTVWITSPDKSGIVAEVPAKDVPSKGTAPFDALSNTIWSGTETRAPHDKVIFEFLAGGSVFMTSGKVRVPGIYSVAGDGRRFTMEFPGPKIGYAGSIADAPHSRMVAVGRSLQNLALKGWSLTILKQSGSQAPMLGRFATSAGSGTGSLVDSKHRLVLTAAHLVRDSGALLLHFPANDIGDLLVSVSDYQKRPGIRGKVVLKEARADLALVRLETLPEGVAPIALSQSPPQPGQGVRSLGTPGSAVLWAFSLGKVHERSHGAWEVFDGFTNRSLRFEAMKIETETALIPGDSGSPLVDDRGDLVGVAQGSNILAPNTSLFIDVTECRTLLEKYYKTLGETSVREPQGANPDDIARLPLLLKNLQDKDSATRLQAIQALGKLGTQATIAFGKLFPVLKDDDAVLRRAASDALEKVPPHKADAQMLLHVFQDTSENPEMRLQSLKALARLGVGPEVKDVPFLGKSLASADPEMRCLAADGLAHLGALAKPAIPSLLASLKLPDKVTRLAALRAIGAIGPAARTATPALVDTLKDAEAEVGVGAAQALIQLGESKEAVPFLSETIKHGSGGVRKRACLALAGLGAEARPAVNELILALDDSEVRPAAAEALVKIGKPAAEVISKKIVKTVRNDKARLSCIEILGRIGHTSNNVFSALRIIYANDPQPENRQAAFRTMQKLLGKG